MIHVRFANEEDCETIYKFISDLAEFERLAHEVKTSPQELHQQLFGKRPAAEVLIAEKDNVPIGFALFFQNFSTFLGKPGIYLEDLFVTPAHRGSGAGGLLMRRLAQIAHERGCGRMEWAVLDWNEHAIGYYKSIGAGPKSDWTIYRLEQPDFLKLSQSSSQKTERSL